MSPKETYIPPRQKKLPEIIEERKTKSERIKEKIKRWFYWFAASIASIFGASGCSTLIN